VPGSGAYVRTVHRPRETEPEILVTLVLSGAGGKADSLVFAERQVRYAYLEERLQPSHERNFATFLGDLLKWAPDAFFPASFRAVAAGRRMQVVKVVGRLDYGNYVRWAMCCAAARGHFGVLPEGGVHQ
jgi:hypothetical protein